MTAQPRLASHVWISALLKRSMSAGVMATVLARGDATAGSLSLVCRGRDGRCRWLTATTDAAGGRAWLGGREDFTDADISQRIERLQRMDPDAWVVELECTNPASLINEPILPAG